MPSFACGEQNSAVLLPATPNDGLLLQLGCPHLLLTTFTMPSFACGEQNSAVLLPSTPYNGRLPQSG